MSGACQTDTWYQVYLDLPVVCDGEVLARYSRILQRVERVDWVWVDDVAGQHTGKLMNLSQEYSVPTSDVMLALEHAGVLEWTDLLFTKERMSRGAEDTSIAELIARSVYTIRALDGEAIEVYTNSIDAVCLLILEHPVEGVVEIRKGRVETFAIGS